MTHRSKSSIEVVGGAVRLVAFSRHRNEPTDLKNCFSTFEGLYGVQERDKVSYNQESVWGSGSSEVALSGSGKASKRGYREASLWYHEQAITIAQRLRSTAVRSKSTSIRVPVMVLSSHYGAHLQKDRSAFSTGGHLR